MCTASWIQEQDGYRMLFNRDESHTRQNAYPPGIHSKDGVLCIAPIDPDAGGSWIGVNEYGLTCCLLNHYLSAFQPNLYTQYISRGLLLLSLMNHISQTSVIHYLQQEDLNQYQPFTLGLLEPGRSTITCTWEGMGQAIKIEEDPPCLLTSSSVDSQAICTYRNQVYRQTVPDVAQADQSSLESFHKSHLPQAGHLSVCMHREAAETVSFSRIVVGETHISFFYTPGAPCRTEPLPPITLKRRHPQAYST